MQNSTEIIWKAFRKQLRWYILNKVSDSSTVDDILQEVFLKIHSNIDSLKEETKIQSWVYKITKNTIIDYYRKLKIKFEDIEIIDVRDEIVEENPAQKVVDGLKDMIISLPVKYAQALLLVEFDGLSQIELAKKIGISVSGAKSRVQRGRQLLRDALLKCCHFEFDQYGKIIDFHPVNCCCLCNPA